MLPLNEQVILERASSVSDAVVEVIEEGLFPVIIGGDHISALGFHTGLARAYGEIGIIWVDTHPDLNTPETSPSGNIHGMVPAGLLGRGTERMRKSTEVCQARDEHVAMVGIRSPSRTIIINFSCVALWATAAFFDGGQNSGRVIALLMVCATLGPVLTKKDL
jgi:arginase family enzyme